MIYVGIDPGLTGAMTLLHGESGILECADIPTEANGITSGKMLSWVNSKALQEMLCGWRERHDLAREHVLAGIERPIAMPRLPAQTIASQFDTFGVLRALIERWASETVFVNPMAWKKLYGIHADKEKARETIKRLYPQAQAHFARKKDHNRAESALIAHFIKRGRE